MKIQAYRRATVWLVAYSIVLLPAEQILAANPTPVAPPARPAAAQSPVRDVALGLGGVLRGQVVDAQGLVCPDIPVALAKSNAPNQVAAAGKTDRNGRFQIQGVTAGVYRVETEQGATVCRLWAPNTAPPSAIPAAMIVQGEGPVRGNLGGLSPWSWTLIGLGIAAAIAVPLALHKEKNDAS